MDPRLEALIRDFQRRVSEALEKLAEAGILRPNSNLDWAVNGIPHLGALASGEEYHKHGYGCAFRFTDGTVVDFDFGDAGQTDGLDGYRLWDFAAQTPACYGFSSCDELLAALDREVASGALRF